MGNGIRAGDPREFNKGRSSKLRVGSRVRQTPEDGRGTYRPKRCGNSNKDDYNPKPLNDKKVIGFAIHLNKKNLGRNQDFEKFT